MYIYIYTCVYVYRVSRVDGRSSISQDQVVPTFLADSDVIAFQRARRRVTISKCVVNLRANELRVSMDATRKQFALG